MKIYSYYAFAFVYILVKNCYKINTRYYDAFETKTMSTPDVCKETKKLSKKQRKLHQQRCVKTKVRRCQSRHCQKNKECHFFTLDASKRKCSLHRKNAEHNKGDFKGSYTGPRYCGKYLINYRLTQFVLYFGLQYVLKYRLHFNLIFS